MSRARDRQAATPRRVRLAPGGLAHLDYTDVATLRRFISDRGKIRSRRVTGLSVREQRMVAVAVRNAREMALLPYPSGGR